MFIKKKKTSAKADFEKFLKSYNCAYSIGNEENTTVFNFEFQAGRFVAAIRKQDDCIEVTYPTIDQQSISLLPLIRSKCNEHNYNNILFKYSYSINHEEGIVDVHLSFFNNTVNSDTMVEQLKAAFYFQHEWQRDLNEAISIAKDSENSDLESSLYKHKREMYLLRQLELKHQFNGTAADLASGTGALTLWQMLETVAPLPKSQLLFLTVNTVAGQQRLEDADDIRNFDLRHALVKGDGKEARLTRDYAVLDLHYRQGLDEAPRMATIALTAEGQDEHAIYTRVTVTMPPRNASRINSLSNESRQPHSVSMLIALDCTDAKQRQQEFDYMWTDALLKAKNGERDKMSEEQQMLSQVHSADVAYNLYWGEQMFYSNRYYEAILHFENVFSSYRETFFDMKAEHKHVFMETAYKMGFCNNELGLYKQAFYYLDLMANDGNIRHTMELVNAMANSKDLRLFNYTEGVMDEVKRNFDQEEELPENIRDFINFLRRRRGYAYIDFNQLDQAEKIFTKMLDEEENADYAINELAYIKKLRQQRGEDITPSPQTPPKGDLPF